MSQGKFFIIIFFNFLIVSCSSGADDSKSQSSFENKSDFNKVNSKNVDKNSEMQESYTFKKVEI